METNFEHSVTNGWIDAVSTRTQKAQSAGLELHAQILTTIRNTWIKKETTTGLPCASWLSHRLFQIVLAFELEKHKEVSALCKIHW